MIDLVKALASALVDHPEQVSVEETTGSRGSVVQLSVAPSDIGKVIGKEGRTARAIRTLLAATSAKQRKRAVLDILE